MSVRIRMATLADAEAMHRIHRRAVIELCKDSYTPAQANAWLSGREPASYHSGISAGEMFVALDGNRIVAMGHALPGVIEGIFVDPDYTGSGIGRLLIEHAMMLAAREYSSSIRLDATLNSQGFYLKFGFTPQETITYSIGGEELPFVVMTKPVSNDRPIKALGEIALRVEDLDRMQAFYENVVGLKLMRRFPTSAFFEIAPGYGGHTAILALFDRQAMPGYQGIRKVHTTVDHIAFTIDLADFAAEKARLERLGQTVDLSNHGWVQWRSLYINDPEGNRVEWVCYDPSVPKE